MLEIEHQNNHVQANLDCALCQGENFAVMLNRALYDRYLSNMNIYYTDYIDDFIEQEITPETCKYRQQLCDSNDQELLKRQYASQQFPGKFQMLSQYYKFHRDIPKIFEKNVFKILGRYYDRLRHYDYKKIKQVLKDQQGISLTTQKSDQTSIYSDDIIKSRYSTVLHDLQKNSQSQSQILQDFCQKIDVAFEKINFKKDFKGQYYSGEKKFQQYLLNIKKVNPNKGNRVQFLDNYGKPKNYNLFNKPLNNVELNNIGLKTQRTDNKKKILKKKIPEITFQSNNVLKQSLKNFKRSKNKNVKSIQKTTANETISRQQKSKRLQKLQKTLQYEIQKNHNQMFKPLSTGLIGLKSNAMLKTLDQIYKPNVGAQKYHSDKSRKSSHYQLAQNTNLNKIYQNKLSSRNSTQKLKSKITSSHNSKQINLNQKDYLLIDLNEKGDTDRTHNNKRDPHHRQQKLRSHNQRLIKKQQKQKSKQRTIVRQQSRKKLSRSKSVSRTLNSHKKSSKKMLKTIDHTTQRTSHTKNISHKKQLNSHSKLNSSHNKLLDKFLQDKQKIFDHQPKIRQRSASRKSINSSKKQRTSSKTNLHSTQKLQKSSSKSNINSKTNSARFSQIDKIKFQTIDPQANRNIENFLEKKLTLIQKGKSKSKF